MIKVSVIMSAYNAEQYIKEAVDSILSQTLTDFECIVVDDGSTDRTLSILQTYGDERLIIITRENKGVVASRNEAIDIAKGLYIAIMDADDISLPTRFEKQVGFLEAHQDTVAVGCCYDVIDENGCFLFYSQPPYADKGVKKLGVLMHYMAHSAMMARATALKKINGYRSEMTLAEDRDVLYRISKYGSLYNIQEKLLKYRRHSSSITSSPLKSFKIAYSHTIAYILHAKKTDNNFKITFIEWTFLNYMHLYVSSFFLGVKIMAFNIIEKFRK